MTTRDKLIEFLLEWQVDSPYFNHVGEIADAIIESGLIKDEKVYKYVNGNYCSKCNHFLSFRGYSYCPTCGAKLKE